MRSSMERNKLLSGCAFADSNVPAGLDGAAAAAGQNDRQIVVAMAIAVR